MNKPKDYPEPQEVRDYAAERGIKFGALAQGVIQSLILAFIIGMFNTLTDIRGLISDVNTKAELNARDIQNHTNRLDRHEQAINKIRGEE